MAKCRGRVCNNPRGILCAKFVEIHKVMCYGRPLLQAWLLADLKVALQILGQKCYKNTEKSSLYSQSLLISIHKTQVVESHQITREIRDLLRPRSTPTGNTVYFLNEQLAHLHTENTQTELQI